ncbi:MAG: insulinase family protein, partial [Ruminococcus sp.]|nr:insulinase family protein [Candidatus Copronaster equi]
MYIEKIADSVRLCAVNTDRFKTCCINFNIALPLDENASANAIIPYMFKRRCAKYPDLTSFCRVLDELYGANVSAGVIKSGDSQILSFTMTAIDDRFALDDDKVALKCVELLLDLIFNPVTDGNSFPEDIIEQEKRLLVELIENEQNNKRRYALLRCESIMFEDEAYGLNPLGTVEKVKALTPDDVYNAWKRALSIATIQITMVGSMDVEPVSELLKEKFSSIERTPVAIKTEYVTAAPKPDYVCETMPLKQGKLVMGFRTGMKNIDDMAAEMKVAVDIFGGGTYSGLFTVVREKMSLCYYCSAALFNAKGIVMVQSGIEDCNEEKAKKEILNQLSIVANGEFSDETFASSIKSLTDSILSNSDTPEDICVWYGSQLFRQEIKTLESYAEEIREVDKAKVIHAAKTIMLDTVFMLKSNGEVADDE